MENFLINTGLYLSYAMLGIATISAFIFPLVFYIKNPKKAKATLIGILGLAVIFLLAYLFSSDELYKSVQSTIISKLVGGGLIMFYILFAAAILVAVYSEIAKIFK